MCHALIMLQLDVEALRTLMTVIDCGSITRAASVLQVSRSAASWRIKRLEEHVGQELLLRDGRTISPSRAAHAILTDARILVETHDRVAQHLESADLTGMVTIGADTDADVSLLTRVLGSFRRVNPGVDVNLVVNQAEPIRNGLASGQIDIALVQGVDEHLLATDRVLWSDDLVWATSNACPFVEAAVPLVTFGVECFYRTISEPILDKAGIDYRVALSVPTTIGVVASVEDGLGVAVLPAHRMTDRLTLWPRAAELPNLPQVHAIVRTAPSNKSESVERLVDLLEAELKAAAPALKTAP